MILIRNTTAEQTTSKARNIKNESFLIRLCVGSMLLF